MLQMGIVTFIVLYICFGQALRCRRVGIVPIGGAANEVGSAHPAKFNGKLSCEKYKIQLALHVQVIANDPPGAAA
jgi:hypothetical protein